MKIQKLVVEMITSPFANVLAIANLTLMALLVSIQPFDPISSTSAIYELNGPAIVVSVLLMGSAKAFVLVPPLIYLQWICIAAFAKLVANAIRVHEVD